WFARQVRNYRKQQAVTATIEQSKQAVPAAPQLMKNALPSNMKPMIGPQWPVKMAPGAARPRLQRPPLPTRESVKPAQPPAPAGLHPCGRAGGRVGSRAAGYWQGHGID